MFSLQCFKTELTITTCIIPNTGNKLEKNGSAILMLALQSKGYYYDAEQGMNKAKVLIRKAVKLQHPQNSSVFLIW